MNTATVSSLTPLLEGGNTYTFTMTVPTGNANGLQMSVSMDGFSGTSPQLDMYTIQLEEGSVATLFEQRPIGLELSLCQRYYYKYEATTLAAFPIYNSTANFTRRCVAQFPVTMRASPTVLNITQNGGFSATPTVNTQSTDHVLIAGTASSATAYTGVTSFTAEAEL